ncbi:MAG: hypothetical protein E6Q06_02130 [Candidatus Moraniibacteriota bacterium]|nr:MAG: hypothetical protein E6Q06_02130 [Candidatus Moranbacteria bacterium]
MYWARQSEAGLACAGPRDLRPRDPHLRLKQTTSCVYGGTCKLSIGDMEKSSIQFKAETNGLARQEHTVHDILRVQPLYGKTATFIQQYQETTLDGNLLRARPMQYVSPSLGVVYTGEHSAKPAAISAMLDREGGC